MTTKNLKATKWNEIEQNDDVKFEIDGTEYTGIVMSKVYDTLYQALIVLIGCDQKKNGYCMSAKALFNSNTNKFEFVSVY